MITFISDDTAGGNRGADHSASGGNRRTGFGKKRKGNACVSSMRFLSFFVIFFRSHFVEKKEKEIVAMETIKC